MSTPFLSERNQHHNSQGGAQIVWVLLARQVSCSVARFLLMFILLPRQANTYNWNWIQFKSFHFLCMKHSSKSDMGEYFYFFYFLLLQIFNCTCIRALSQRKLHLFHPCYRLFIFASYWLSHITPSFLNAKISITTSSNFVHSHWWNYYQKKQLKIHQKYDTVFFIYSRSYYQNNIKLSILLIKQKTA